MLELFQTDRMCFEDISDIFAKPDAAKMIVERKIFRIQYLRPENFEEICKILKAHLIAVCYRARPQCSDTEILLQYWLTAITIELKLMSQ